jgi:hypothetical protein
MVLGHFYQKIYYYFFLTCDMMFVGLFSFEIPAIVWSRFYRLFPTSLPQNFYYSGERLDVVLGHLYH